MEKLVSMVEKQSAEADPYPSIRPLPVVVGNSAGEARFYMDSCGFPQYLAQRCFWLMAGVILLFYPSCFVPILYGYPRNRRPATKNR